VEQALAYAQMDALRQRKVVMRPEPEQPKRSITNKPGNQFDQEISQKV
jgi:hypothetical protein